MAIKISLFKFCTCSHNFFINPQMLPFQKFVKMEIDRCTSNCHYNSSKPMQICHIRMQIRIKGNLFKISIPVQYNALKSHIFDCGVQFIQHNNRRIYSLVNHDVTTKHNTQINAKFKIINFFFKKHFFTRRNLILFHPPTLWLLSNLIAFQLHLALLSLHVAYFLYKSHQLMIWYILKLESDNI